MAILVTQWTSMFGCGLIVPTPSVRGRRRVGEADPFMAPPRNPALVSAPIQEEERTRHSTECTCKGSAMPFKVTERASVTW